ncbi:uncharacterized protein LOC114373014 [Glycine soja]|uniref:uncharacterized protein LOC114373014 n=1 Tax=Glycine soja TaxID=3848 RepID=UPI00103D91F7|nr:uncharacterized protein LOC114373014 [Glycine soja]
MLHSVLLIANEVVEEAKRCHKPCIVFKVDYEKAYDSVSWEFLTYMMSRMGFCSKWIKWIEGCLKSAYVSVLVNEALNGLMSQAQAQRLYKGFLVGSNKVEISTLQYVDDTIFFREATMENVRAIKAMLRAFELHQGELWGRVLESKYGGWRNLDDALRVSRESIWWRDLKLVTQHPQHGHILNNSTLWKVNCGDKFEFWEDNWLGGAGSLLDKYLRLYTISSQQNQIIQHMGTVKDSGWEWEFRWRRTMFDNELDMAISFLKDVESHNIQQQERDQWVWMADSNGQYSIRSAYNVLREDIAEEIHDGAYEELWKLKVPTKIATFAWRLFRDRLPTKTNL